ncbi:putative disease resistance protein At3g14460 isoform X3 [Medicago truncatula]|uniref:putative disease resistance protein At3g14460 isoform X3 n=1 Tax=Medicago truncatula TaxID=3880 RepID=UPI001966D595|nr:putative disease resistance protein At3g14460 isoform X3 [Medicago truncatula]
MHCATKLMHGIGKSALASVLYNDPQVKEKFRVMPKHDFYVFRESKHYHTLWVLENILKSLPSQTVSGDNLNAVYPHFLLVLDDMIDTRSVNWTLLMDIFNAEKTRRTIIITTRDERVPKSMQNFSYVHYMRPLETEDCWSIVARHALGECNNQQRSNLEEIGRKIAKKCDGLPLAAVALGNFLRTKWSPNYWNNVLIRDIWELIRYDVQPSLHSNYDDLSDPLKSCFEYCSIFQKKSILEKNVVVQLWIAAGLVKSSEDQEKVGEEYFDELVSNSLIHRRSIGNEEANFEMQSLLHDFATMVSSSYCAKLGKQHLDERIKNLSYNRGLYDSFNKFDKLYAVKGIRTFLALPLQKQLPFSLLSNKVVHDLLPTMKQLRVLSLSNYSSITEVPNSIENFLYLRYLNLSHTKIERLSSATCKLYNLQFLLLAGCRRLIELPEDMGKLVNLRLLDVSDTALREMPVQIAKLENLHTLSDFVVSKHKDGLKLSELGKFPHLHGKLFISQLQNVNDPFEAYQANMKMKEGIAKLALEWDRGSTFPDSQIQIQSVVLEHLQPSTNLRSLTIKGYGGISFPNWLGDFLFSNMVYLRISNCDDCLWLPPLGQLGNLKKLIIEGMQSVQTIGTEFYGSDGSPSFQPFPSLETLHFENMQEWEEWNLIGGTAKEFPSLKTLSLSACPKLRVGNIPDKFLFLIELELRECPLLMQSMPSSDHVFRNPAFPLNSLQQLTIDVFPSQMSFPTVSLPKTLKSLIISNCESLEFLPHEYLHHYTSLEELKISYSCNSMISFTLGALPVLKSLFIEGCKNLKSILIAEDASEKSLSFLRSIKIWDCNELESFPPGGLHTPNLIYFVAWKCQKLQSLPEAMDTLNDLQEMEIDDLPNLQSFAIDDLPISLRELTVGSVRRILRNTQPTWEHRTCLSVLRINGNTTVSTILVPLLPRSLVTLCISGLNNTSIDGMWLQYPYYLRNLEIVNAPKLKSLPKEGLPSSLLVLSMTFCPLLKVSLQRKRGKEWRKVAHIPSIIIDDELIT